MAELNVWMRNFRSRNTETKCYCFVFCLSPLTLAQVTLLSWPLLEAFGFKMIRSVLWCPVAIRSTGDWVKWATCSLFNRWYKKLFMASSHHPWLYLWLENLLHHPITKGRMLLKLEICHALILFFIFSCFLSHPVSPSVVMSIMLLLHHQLSADISDNNFFAMCVWCNRQTSKRRPISSNMICFHYCFTVLCLI